MKLLLLYVTTLLSICAVGHGCDETISGFRGNKYRGCQTRTRTGKTCQRWTSQTPHSHSNGPKDHTDKGLGDHNYCRNPDGEPTIWCYTTSPASRWEYCDPLVSIGEEAGVAAGASAGEYHQICDAILAGAAAQDDISWICGVWVPTLGCGSTWADACPQDHPLGASYNNVSVSEYICAPQCHSTKEELCSAISNGEFDEVPLQTTCDALMRFWGCGDTWEDMCGGDHPWGAQYNRVEASQICVAQCIDGIQDACNTQTMNKFGETDVCSTWVRLVGCDATWGDVCQGDFPGGAMYNNIPIKDFPECAARCALCDLDQADPNVYTLDDAYKCYTTPTEAPTTQPPTVALAVAPAVTGTDTTRETSLDTSSSPASALTTDDESSGPASAPGSGDASGSSHVGLCTRRNGILTMAMAMIAFAGAAAVM